MKHLTGRYVSGTTSLLTSATSLVLGAWAALAQPHPTSTWAPPGGSDNLWGNPANWSPAGVPSSSAIVVINNGTVNAVPLGAFSVYRVDLNGGTLTTAGLTMETLNHAGGVLAGNNVITGGATWTGGNWNNGGAVTVAGNATLTIAGNGVHDLANATLTNHGTVVWTGGAVRGGSTSPGTRIYNTGLWEAQCDQELNGDYGGNGLTFINTGTFRKSAGTGNTTLDGRVALDNTGVVEVTSGTLALYGSGGGSGNLAVAPGATLYFNGTYHLTGAPFSGGGGIVLAGGQLTVDGALVSTNMQQTGGALKGPLLLDGVYTWTAGNWNNAGAVTLAGTALLKIASGADHDLANCAVTNYGQVVWTGGRIRGGGNSPGTCICNFGTWETQCDKDFNSDYGGNGVQFYNLDLFSKTAGSGTTALRSGVRFENAGLVDVASGTLSLAGTGSGDGLFDVGAGAGLSFNGNYSLSGTPFAGGGAIVLAGGQLTLQGTLTSTNMQQTGGTLHGPLWLDGVFTWTDGDWNNAGTVTFAEHSLLRIVGGADHDMANCVLTNYGTVMWSGGRIRGGGNSSGTAIYNRGLWEAQCDQAFTMDYRGLGLQFYNSGTFRKSGGAGNTTVSAGVRFQNSGLTDLASGTLVLSGVGGGNGSFQLASNASLYVTGTYDFDGAPFTGEGGMVLAGGTMTVEGTLSGPNLQQVGGTLAGAKVISGVFTWTAGTWNNAGAVTLASNSVLNIVSGADHDLANCLFTNYGTVVWSGGRLRGGYSSPGTQIYNFGLWDARSDQTFGEEYGGNGLVFQNLGTFRKSASSGTTTLPSQIGFNSSGRVEVESGTLALNASGGGGGSFHSAAGAALVFNGSYSLSDGSRFAGAGVVQLAGGTLSLAGLLTLQEATFQHLGGTFSMSGDGQLATTNGGSYDWQGGTLRGRLTLSNGVVTRLSGSGAKNFTANAELHNFGVITWAGGALVGECYYSPVTLRNHSGSRFIADGGVGWTRTYGNHEGLLVVDAGAEFLKADSREVSSEWQLYNQGLMLLQAGTLHWNRGGASSGLFTNQPGARLAFGGGTHTLSQGVWLAGDGNYRVEGGTVAAAGVVTHSSATSPSVLELAAGEITGSNFVAAGAFLWTGGWIGGQFTVATGAVANLNGGGGKYFSRNSLFENRGTVNWNDGGSVAAECYYGPSTILNSSNAMFNLTADGTPFDRTYGNYPFYFQNLRGGLLSKTSPGAVTLSSLALIEQGELRIERGALKLNTPVTLADGARFTGAGAVQLIGDTVSLTGLLTLDGPTFAQQGGTFALPGGGSLATLRGGLFEWDGGWISGVLTLTNGALGRISSSAAKYLARNTEFHNYGSVTWTDGPILGECYYTGVSLLNHASGRLTIAGPLPSLDRIYGSYSGSLRNEGALELGTPGGQLTATGWLLTQTATGVLELALAGTNAPAQFGVWSGNSPTGLGGTLRVTLADGFTPAAGHSFAFLSAGSLSGGFASAQLPALPEGLTMVVDQAGATLRLVVAETRLCTAPPAGLRAWYPAEDSPLDVVGLRQGRLVGGTDYAYGKVGRAFRMDGANDSVELGNWFNWQEFTLALWVKPGPSQVNYADLLDNNHNGSRSWVLEYANSSDSTNGYFLLGGGPGVGNVTFGLAKEAWQHLVVSVDPNRLSRVYVNGALVGSAQGSGLITYDGSQFLRLGAWGGGGRNFNGAVDELMFFDHALSSNEIVALAAADLAGLCHTNANCLPPPVGLVGWWPGDHDASDLAGTNTGRLINTATLAPGLAGGAFRLDGASGLVDLGNSPSLWVSAGDFTAAAWVEFDSLAGDQSILDKMAACGPGHCDGWRLAKRADGRFRFCLGGGAGGSGCTNGNPNTVQSTTLPTVGRWYHVAAVKSAASLSLYVNGALEETQPLSAFTDTHSTDLLLGAGSTGAFLNGLVDEALLVARVLAADEIAALFAAGPSGLCKPAPPGVCVPLPVGAVAWWPANGNAADAFGLHHGTFHNGAALAPGVAGLAFSLGGTNDSIEVPHAADLSFGATAPLTLQMWVYRTGDAPTMHLAGKRAGCAADDSGNYQLALHTATGEGLVWGPLASHHDLARNTWQHVAATFDGASFRLYLNGQQIGLQPGSNGPENTAPLRIGGAGDCETFTGLLDEVALFNRALSANEIAALYLAGSAGFCNTNPLVPTLPDLAVHSLEAPSQATIALPAQIVFTLTNRGGSAAFGPWANSFVLATDANGGGAQSLGSATFTGELVAGGSLRVTQTVTLPANAYGPRFCGVRLDTGNNVVESIETNNSAYAAGPTAIAAPDLAVVQVTGSADAFIGQTAQLVFTLTNSGDATAVGPWLNQFFVADNPAGSGARSLGSASLTYSLAPGGLLLVTQSVALPTDLSGARFLGVLVDSANQVPESAETNNGAYATVPVAIHAPDLSVSQVSGPAGAIIGQTAQVVFTVTNSGDATAAGPWRNEFFLADAANGSGARSLGSASLTNSLAPGDSLTATQTVTLPNNVSGARFLGVLTDSGNSVPESSEANNRAFAAVPVTIHAPDLFVLAISPPPSAVIGQTIQLVFTLTNGGDATAVAPWHHQVYLANTAGGSGAQSLGVFWFSNTLVVSDWVSVTQTVLLPNNRSGLLYLGVAVDSAHEVPESNEANNLAYASVALQVNASDLVPLEINGPATALAGQTVPLVFTLTNRGSTPATGPWANQFLLAADGAGNGAQALGSAVFSNTLAVGGWATVTQMVTLPSATLGARYLGVTTDSANQVPEANENNNTAFAPTPVAISGPDLAALRLEAPAGVTFAQTFTVTFAVTNLGATSAGATWNDRLYFSASSNSLAGATLLATLAGPSPLEPGAGYTRTPSVTIPLTANSTPGGYYLVVVADAAGAQVEMTTANNSLATPIALTLPPLPDLAVADLRGPVAAVMGQAVPLVLTLTNRGEGVAHAPWQNRVLLAAEANGADARVLGSADFTNDLAPGAALIITQSVILPFGITGTRYFGAVADSANAVRESDETNNTTFASSGLSISGPDLVVARMDAPATANFGESFTVQFAVTNLGGAPATATWNDRLYLSAAADSLAGATLLGSFAASSPLPAGEGYTRGQVVTLPLTTSSVPGDYYLVAVVDGGAAQLEADEANNLRATPISMARPPLADLAVVEVLAPDRARAGVPVPLVWSVTNQGSLDLTAAVWSEAVGLWQSNGAVATLAEFRFTNSLAAGESLIRTQSVVLPFSLAAGPVNFLVTTDFRGDWVEENEANNARLATNLTAIPAELTLTLALGDVTEGSPPFTGTLTRNGPTTAPLVVALTNSRPDKLTVTNLVTLPAGSPTATFTLTPVRNGLVDGDTLVTLGASAPDYLSAAAAVVVRNLDLPLLTLACDSPAVLEGQTVGVTVARDYGLDQELTVVLASSDPSHLVAPVSVTIPSNQTSRTFAVLAVENTLLEGVLTNRLQATASGFAVATVNLALLDNDLPTVTLELVSTNLSESDGPLATRATLTRLPVGPRPLVIDLVNSNPNKVTAPATVVFAENQASVSFPIGAVDNLTVDGDALVQLQVFIRASDSTWDLAEGQGAWLVVRDDDGPTLRLTLARDMVPEGLNPATFGTVTRNTATNSPLLVHLASSVPAKATVPASVTIPAGATGVTFPIATVDDGTPSGNKSVVFTATATNFSPGLSSVVVSDIQLADLVVASLTAPTNGLTDANVTLTYRVENRGLAPAPTGVVTRVYLSTDAVLGHDTFLGEYAFPGTLNPGQFFEQTLPLRLPSSVGRYWVAAVTDADNQVNEIREDNNSALTALPMVVAAAYTAVVQTPVTLAVAPTNVLLSGQATLRGGGAAAYVPVNIHLHLRGTHRVLQAFTDAGGHFATEFTPLPNEAGLYQAGAAHPGEPDAPVQTTFTLLGMRLSPAGVPLLVREGATATGAFSVLNLGDTPLGGLTVRLVSQPGNLRVTLGLPSTTVAGQAGVPLNYSVTALDLSQPQGIVTVEVTTQEGLSALASLFVAIEPLRSKLAVVPGSLSAAMVRGDQRQVEFSVLNSGGAASGPVTIATPDLPWLRVASTNPLPSLAVGASNLVTLLLTPDTNLALGPYRGSLVVSAADSSASVPFDFLCVSENRGDLLVEAVDEFTYYAAGAPKLSNAVVVVRDHVSQLVVTNGATDAEGRFFAAQLPEAHYDLEVSAAQHLGFKGTVLLVAGLTNEFQPFLARETVQYRWTVVPTTIEDRTRITIETTFETFVPVPVVTIDPPLIDLADFQGDMGQITLQITNHGLVAAENFHLVVATHPSWELTPLITDLGRLPARSGLTVPVTVRRLGGSEPQGTAGKGLAKAGSRSGPCGFSLAALWDLLCGKKTNGYGAQVTFMNAGYCGWAVGSSSSGSAGGNVGGGGFGGPGGGGGVAGGTPPVVFPHVPFPPVPSQPSVSQPSILHAIFCGCESNTTLGCYSIPLVGTIADLAAKGLSKALSAVPGIKNMDANANASAKVCLCCDEDGMGLRLEGAAGLGFSGQLSIPLVGLPSISGSKHLQGYDLDYELGLGCEFSPAVDFGASLTASTECHLRHPQACAELSANIDLPLECKIVGSVTVKKDGVVITNLEAKASATLQSGLSGSLRYCLDGGLSGNITVKPLTFSAGVSVNIPGYNFDWNVDKELLAGYTYPKGAAGALLFDQIARETDEEIHEALRQYQLPPHLAAKNSRAKETSTGDGVCARVKIRLDQDLVMARNAFNATLELDNQSSTSTLQDIQVIVTITDTNGAPANHLFGLRAPVLANLGAVDGTGALSTKTLGTASWIIVPTRDAAPQQPTVYGVGGLLSYTFEGKTVTVPLYSAPITVYPDPLLVVKYFHQRDVFSDDPFTPEIEPSLPFNLAVMVENRGYGTAQNVRIISGQPRIVENEKGLLVDFKIIGSQVDGQPRTPSLTVVFGDIGPGQRSIGRWLFTSTLQGLFLDYKATFEHLDSLGKTNLSLIDDVSIHEMIHLVQAQSPFEDGRPDFLVNDAEDPDDLPDTLYLSDGTTNAVQAVTQSTLDAPPGSNHLTVRLEAPMPAGWGYLRVAEPGDGQFLLRRVVRSDNVEIPLHTNVWTTDRTFLGGGRRPLRENLLHLLDYSSSGTYTLYYEPIPAPDTNAPISSVAALPTASYPQFNVNWSGADEPGGSGLSAFEVFVSVDGGPFAPWLQGTTLRGAVYAGQLGHAYAFYCVATDAAGNRESAPLQPQARTTVSRTNAPPLLSLAANVVLDAGQPLSLDVSASDPDASDVLTFTLGPGAPAGVQVHPSTGHLSWPTSRALGGTTNPITVIATDNGQPRLSATGQVAVVLRAVNTPPILSPIPDYVILQGRSLTFTNYATDSDLPRQSLVFSLGPEAPAGATITPDTGLFRWHPGDRQAGSTNRLAVIVIDNGIPSLSATQSFTVIVRRIKPLFVLGIGTTNVLAGAGAVVPLSLEAGLDLTEVSFALEANSDRLTNGALRTAPDLVATAALTHGVSNRYAVRFTSLLEVFPEGQLGWGQLAFETRPDEHSAIVTLTATGLTGLTSGGQSVGGGAVTPGRVFILGREPILDLPATPDAARTLLLYGLPGRSYLLLAATNLGTAVPWRPVSRVDLTTTSASVPLPPLSGPTLFYRVCEWPAGALSLRRVSNQIILEWPATCAGCQLQQSPRVGPEAVWTPTLPPTLTAGRYQVALPTPAGTRFYRLLLP